MVLDSTGLFVGFYLEGETVELTKARKPETSPFVVGLMIYEPLYPVIVSLACRRLGGCRQSANAGIAVGIGVGGPGPGPNVVYASPGPGAVWIRGHWEWEGGRRVWWPGYWEYPPYAGGVWINGGWGWHNGHRYWRHGGWGRGGHWHR
jgi:hypothetical protein